ncbi:serine/threonine protein kinase, partial [Streptomyces sp. NPDC055078]
PPVQRAARTLAPLTDVVPRRTLVIVAVVVALAIVATVLFLTLGDGDKDKGAKGKQDTPASDAAKTPGGAGNPPEGDSGTDPTDGTTGKPDPAGPGRDDSVEGGPGKGDDGAKPPGAGAPVGSGVPAGYTTVSSDAFRFTMAMPKGFKQTGIAGRNSGGIFSSGGGFPRIQVDFNASPKDDAEAAWAAAMTATAAASDNYKHRYIRPVEYKGYPTVADWEFERDQQGHRVRVLNRGFKVDAKRGYSIMISCKATEWDKAECKTLRDTAFATFKPKD